MRLIFVLIVAVTMAFAFTSCKSSSAPPTFCDTACLKDTIKFTKDNHVLKPYVYISAKDCLADTVIWSYYGMGINRKMALADMAGGVVRLNKDFIRCVINDTSYAWLLFNDCGSGRGFYLKIPFNKTKTIGRKASAINGLDPRFSVTEGLVAYTDRGNIFVEEMATGKNAMMTFGAETDIDYNAIHETIDSVNITPTRIWAKVRVKETWKELQKNITLK